MWNSFMTDEKGGITAAVTTYSGGDGDQTHAYVARPMGDSELRPGIVLVHHLPGWDEF
jgi:carboxymethylenebutenolidase